MYNDGFDGYLTPGEYDRREAELGASWLAEDGELPSPWILSSRDVWYPNPSYDGPPVPHPEYRYENEEDDLDPEAHEAYEKWEADYRAALWFTTHERVAWWA